MKESESFDVLSPWISQPYKKVYMTFDSSQFSDSILSVKRDQIQVPHVI